MPEQTLARRKRGVLVVSVLIVALIAAAVGVTIWRYEQASSLAEAEAGAHHDAELTGQLVTSFWHEREAMNEYLVAPTAEVLSEVSTQRNEFAATAARLGQGESAAESRLRLQAVAGNQALDALFTRVSPAAGTGAAAAAAASERLAHAEAAVLVPLNRLDRLQQQRAAAAHDAAGSAAGQALWVAIVAAVLAVAAGAGFVWYVMGLLNQAFARTAEQRVMLVRHGELLEQIQATSAVLGEVTRQTRAGAGEAVAATSEMSASVAQTSATIEELAASAGSIADNAHAVGQAARQVGDTVRDMREQAERIAGSALALGERAQKISEIVEVITSFTGQTNLLALNAAIEAARAGEAGKGFAVVASEVRKLAQRSIESAGSITEIVAAVQDEANKMIEATGQGTHQARHVGELMRSAAAMAEQSILATQQQKSAADQVEAAITQIRTAADQLTADQAHRATTADRLEALVCDLAIALQHTIPASSPASRATNGANAS
jgi:methyl-accepting chemotaxis protein